MFLSYFMLLLKFTVTYILQKIENSEETFLREEAVKVKLSADLVFNEDPLSVLPRCCFNVASLTQGQE